MKLTKKEIKLYTYHKRQCSIVIKHYITISGHDTENILKVHDKMLDHCDIIIERKTYRIRLFNNYIYFNTVYGGIYEWSYEIH